MLIAPVSALSVGDPNGLAHQEQEVAIEMLPNTFALLASEVSVSEAVQALKDMGFQLPGTIHSLSALDAELKFSQV